MEIIEKTPTDLDVAIERIQRIGRPILTVEELYGPGPGPDDPEDLEQFLALLEEQRRPASVPDEDGES